MTRRIHTMFKPGKPPAFASALPLLALLGGALCTPAVPALASQVKTDTILVSPPTIGEDGEAQLPEDLPALTTDELSTEEAAPASDRSADSTDVEKPTVQYDLSSLPKPVARMHDQLLKAALSGDLQQLRMVLESNEVMPTLSLSPIDDPIDFLKESSGDGEGFEILGILADTLDAGFVHVDKGTPQEMYIWPYFARYPLHELTNEQKVELYRIVTAGDFEEMESYGMWLFYRVGIGPDGTLHYFVAGE